MAGDPTKVSAAATSLTSIDSDDEMLFLEKLTGAWRLARISKANLEATIAASFAGVGIANTFTAVQQFNQNVQVGGAAGQNGVTIEPLGIVRIRGATGGWARGYYFNGKDGTNYGGFGVLGADDSVTRYWIGDSQTAAGVTVMPTTLKVGIGNVTAPSAALHVKTFNASDVGLQISGMASQSANSVTVTHGDGPTVRIFPSGVKHNGIKIDDFDNGGGYGPYMVIGRNSNASTPGGGSIGLAKMSGAIRYLHIDNSVNDVLRVHTVPGTSANDLSGTVVGSQTSLRSAKRLLGQTLEPAQALARLLTTPVHEFVYRGDEREEHYHGIVADEFPEVMWDAGRAFSPVTAFGYTVQAIKAMAAEIVDLRAQVAELRGA